MLAQSKIENRKSSIVRRRLIVRGIVQGVGFRPFVYSEARRCELGGFVRNDSAGVTIEVEGSAAALDAFEAALHRHPPPLARIDGIVAETLPPLGEQEFVIAHSAAGGMRSTLIAPDSATCDDCLRELFDPADRRFHYPFINCTNCGPRFTIVQDVPYDRANTTMRVFPMCPACRADYETPLDRRFHAQPNACPVCGPGIDFRWTPEYAIRNPQCAMPDTEIHNSDSIAFAAQRLAAGDILAIKGLGGYHLVCDAASEATTDRLRRRKHREERPFALMAPDLATVRRVCHVSDAEAALLESRRRPIVLLQRRPAAAGCVAESVALHYTTLGIMLPYTPLHHLLLRAFAAAIGPERSALLVMTSGNLSDEPIAYHDDDAAARLAPIADGLLTHNRAIHMRCDDSVARVVADGEQIIRRSRGYAPEPIPLAFEAPVPLLACGGHLKNTFCLVKGRQAFLSHHIGDLENLETLTSFREGIAHYARLFDITPQAVACDLHPEYLATKEPLAIAEAAGIAHLIGVQHHHAHIASVLAEHGIAGPVIGVAADGTGHGSDGAIWGCEIMTADLRSFTRLAHLPYIPLPGGEQAVREPWRVAAVLLQYAYGDAFLDLDIPFVQTTQLQSRWRPLAQMIARGINSPPASSLGRLFDGVAALLGVCATARYEGQAAIELELIAEPTGDAYPFGSLPVLPAADAQPALLDIAPLIRAIVADIRQGAPVAQIAGRFHRTIAALLADACCSAREQSGLNEVALSGGVFQNRLLLETLAELLQEWRFTVYRNRRVPPNDGGLSLGQAAVAIARLKIED
jgi:hydrogenase maturation protein HypF